MNLFPEEFSDIGRTSGLGENVQSPRPSDWGGNLIADVFAWFQTTPGANPNPSVEALYYYANSTYDQFLKDVAAVRAANPTVAAQIDAERREAGLDAPVTPPPPVVVQPPPVVVVQPPPVEVNCPAGFKYDASTKSCIRSAIAPTLPVTPPPVKTALSLEPVYTKEYPYPTAESDIYGYLYGQDELDKPIRRPFNLKKGDPIPVNWQAEQPMTSPGEPARPTTPAAAGTGTLLLAAIAAYLLGS